MMNKSDYNPGDEIELDEYNLIIKIPRESIKLEIKAVFLNDNDELTTVCKTLKLCDIQEARKVFLDNVEDGDDYDARYVITDEGLKFLESLKNAANCKEESE